MSKMEHDIAIAELREKTSTLNKGWYRSCSDLLNKKVEIRGMACLDLCCGNGEFSKILRDQYRMSVTCGDYIPSHLDQARKNGFSTIDIDLDDDSETVDKVAQAYEEKFDLVVNLASIEHVFCTDNLLRFVHKVLKHDGLFIVNTPNMSFLAYRIYSAFSGNRPVGDGHHVRFWDFRYLQTVLFFNGFEVMEDFRRFYALPEDALTRSIKHIKPLGKLISKVFYLCLIAQYLPLLRGLATDELTLLCRKETVTPFGFNYLAFKQLIGNSSNSDARNEILNRLNIAKRRGWLKEHPNMTRLVEDNIHSIDTHGKDE